MKLQAPDGTTSISVNGVTITVEKGVCEVPEASARELMDSHGFIIPGAKAAPVVEPELDKFTDMSRAELIGYIKGKGLPVVPQVTTDELRATSRSQYSPEERAADAAAIEASKLKG